MLKITNEIFGEKLKRDGMPRDTEKQQFMCKNYKYFKQQISISIKELQNFSAYNIKI